MTGKRTIHLRLGSSRVGPTHHPEARLMRSTHAGNGTALALMALLLTLCLWSL